MSNSNEFSRRRPQPGMAAAILAALAGAASLGQLGQATSVRPAVRRHGRVRHGRSAAGCRKPHFSCGYRGRPRTTAGVAPGRGLDGPHGIPYRYNGFPIRLRYQRILIPRNATREHRLELSVFADSRGMKTIDE